MLAQAEAHRLHDLAIVGHEFGESLGQLGLIELAQALDDRFLGRKIAVEIACAHARFVGDVLHCRGVKAVANKGALGRFEDSKPPLGFGGAARDGRGGQRHGGANENECSFS